MAPRTGAALLFTLLIGVMAPLGAACSGASHGQPFDADTDAASLALDAGDAATTSDVPVAPPARSLLTVRGNQLVDVSGATVRLLGVNYSGAEYACIQNRGIFDGPVDDVFVDTIAGWNASVVRVPLNPHCWLDIGGLDKRYVGAAYRDAVGAFARRLRLRGLYVIFEVHWSSPIPGQATAQPAMLDAVTGHPFWRSMAETFGSDRGIVFDLLNEPFLDVTNTNYAYGGDPWECWRRGCMVVTSGQPYEAAGMQALIDDIRGAGAMNVVMLGGLDYANDLRGFLTHLPTDPVKALAASVHLYATKRCASATCWDSEIASVAASVPVVTGELGQNDCAAGFVQQYMAWADPKKIGYLGWTFNVADCAARPSLIADWNGTPTPFGIAFKERFAALAAASQAKP